MMLKKLHLEATRLSFSSRQLIIEGFAMLDLDLKAEYLEHDIKIIMNEDQERIINWINTFNSCAAGNN